MKLLQDKHEGTFPYSSAVFSGSLYPDNRYDYTTCKDMNVHINVLWVSKNFKIFHKLTICVLKKNQRQHNCIFIQFSSTNFILLFYANTLHLRIKTNAIVIIEGAGIIQYCVV